MRRRGMGAGRGKGSVFLTVAIVYICVVVVWGLIAFNLPLVIALRQLLFFGGAPLLTLLIVVLRYQLPKFINKTRRR